MILLLHLFLFNIFHILISTTLTYLPSTYLLIPSVCPLCTMFYTISIIFTIHNSTLLISQLSGFIPDNSLNSAFSSFLS